ncbi:MAG: hypothetical protein Ct9H300mP19_17660 [Dehalococcoidia bacterium]|nr:MAG: hypothetical protein Ct9H300mP19_17660 [Dehalococcoidia bacterium]
MVEPQQSNYAKNSSKRTIVETATEIQKLANDAGSLFIMNDHADIARIVASDGLHVGQKTSPWKILELS